MAKVEIGSVETFGKVAVEIQGTSYRLRWRHQGKRYCLAIGKIGREAKAAAAAKAQMINADILFDRFDPTLAKYSAKHQKLAVSAVAKKIPTLMDLWQGYKKQNLAAVSPTTIKGDWAEVDRVLSKLESNFLELDFANEFLAELLNLYSVSYAKKILTYVRAACYWAIENEKIEKNPYSKLFKRLPKIQSGSRSNKCFEKGEIEEIIKAFQSNEFCSKFSTVKHSYYAEYVEFLALTGCRPEEAIALRWDRIERKNGKVNIIFDQAFSQGELKATKNYESRTFPVNKQLTILLGEIDRSSDLLFPSVQGGFINQHNFRDRYWEPILNKLVATGKVAEYLPPYNLRHSWITRMIRAGLDVGTIAALAGNSPKVIYEHYLAANRKDLVLPDL